MIAGRDADRDMLIGLLLVWMQPARVGGSAQRRTKPQGFVSNRGLMAGERRYQCVFCAKTIASGGLDVSALVLILKWDQPEAVQRSQQFWCHADCFRSRVHESVPLHAFSLAEDS